MYSWLELCRWINSNPIWSVTFFFNDNARFTGDRIHNTRNSHLWDSYNPHPTVKSNNQHRFSVKEWCGVIYDQLIGSYIFPPRHTGDIYTIFATWTASPLRERSSTNTTSDVLPAWRSATSIIRSSGCIWILNSQNDGLVEAVHRIGHQGHRIWTH